MLQIFAPLTHELAQGFLADTSSLALSAHAGQQPDLANLVDLAAQARSLYLMTTLACRSLDRISDCHKIWTDTLETFRKAVSTWTGVSTDHDPVLRFYLQQLERLYELAASRVDLYTISQSERLEHASRRADTSESAFGSRSEEPQDWTDSRPAHVYSMGRI